MPCLCQTTFRRHFSHRLTMAGRDGNGQALRYLEWSSDPDKNDTTYITEYVYVIREADRPMRIEHERHIHGLFPRAEWLRLLSDVGFDATIVRDNYKRDVFVARPKIRSERTTR